MCEYDQTALENMRLSLNTNIELINKINPLDPLSDQQLSELNSISNLIKSIPELVTDKLNGIITSIAYQ